MVRLIDADELIKCIPSEEYNSRFAVMNAPTIEPQKWIPVSVKLPEKRQDVIVTVNDGMIYTDTDEWIGTGFFAYGHNVVAWQSLPDPWKGEEE